MKIKLASCLFAALAIAAAAVYSPSADGKAEAVTVDFVSLHNKANSALQTLQVAEQRRIALQQAAAAAY
jgi:hypothetical protein